MGGGELCTVSTVRSCGLIGAGRKLSISEKRAYATKTLASQATFSAVLSSREFFGTHFR